MRAEQKKLLAGLAVGLPLLGFGAVSLREWITSSRTFETVQEMVEQANPRLPFTVRVHGYYAPGDGGGGIFHSMAGITGTNYGTRIASGSGTHSWERVLDGELNLKMFGAMGDGRDQTAQMASALAAGAGKTVVAPRGGYEVASTLTIAAGTQLNANGARFFNTRSHLTLLNVSGDNVTIRGLELQGAGNALYHDGGRALMIHGTVHDYQTNVLLENVWVRDFGGYGVHSEFAQGQIVGSRFEKIGYAAGMFLSARDWVVSRSEVKTISPGTAGNAYGFAFTRTGLNTNLATHPLSASNRVEFCRLEDIPWEALDTHGGIGNHFLDNVMTNCRKGVALVCVGTTSWGSRFAPHGNMVTGNVIYGTGAGSGIQVAGAGGARVGGWNELAEANVISANFLENCGVAGNANDGAIYVVSTRGTVISRNRIHEPRVAGLAFYYDNYDFSVTGNVIVDPWDNTNAAPACVRFNSDNHSGVIDGNTFARVNPALGNFVGLNGVRVRQPNTTEVRIGENQNSCLTPWVQRGAPTAIVDRNLLF